MSEQLCLIRYHWKPSPNYSDGRALPIKAIVLHSSDGHKDGDIDTMTQIIGHKRVSAHWYVTKTGEYWHLVQDADVAWHVGTGNPKIGYINTNTIGIEQEHIDGEEPWPDIQIIATARLICALRRKHGWLPVVSHASIAWPRGRKIDPHDYPWSMLSAYVAQIDNSCSDIQFVQI